jgi:uncharacterized membrane protein YgaE (UPF0421/DUF939 family)
MVNFMSKYIALLIIALMFMPHLSYADWKDSLKNKASELKSTVKDDAIEKSEKALEELHAYLIELNKAGFLADEVEIELGIILL